MTIAARVVSAARHRDHITHDHSLHRLRERQRVIYKTVVRPCVHGVGAANLQELYVLLKVFEDNCGYGLHPLESGCIQLPGALSIDISRTAKFHFYWPIVWNCLPSALHDNSVTVSEHIQAEFKNLSFPTMPQ